MFICNIHNILYIFYTTLQFTALHISMSASVQVDTCKTDLLGDCVFVFNDSFYVELQ